MWRPPNWDEIVKAECYDGDCVYKELDTFEDEADAMHQADIKYLREHTISKPTDRFRVISVDEEEWQDFIKGVKDEASNTA